MRQPEIMGWCPACNQGRLLPKINPQANADVGQPRGFLECQYCFKTFDWPGEHLAKDEEWIEINITDWDLDEGFTERRRLRDLGYEPVEPLEKEDCSDQPRFRLRCKKISRHQ